MHCNVFGSTYIEEKIICFQAENFQLYAFAHTNISLSSFALTKSCYDLPFFADCLMILYLTGAAFVFYWILPYMLLQEIYGKKNPITLRHIHTSGFILLVYQSQGTS